MRSVRVESQNWLIIPAARAVNEPPPADVSQQAFLLTLTGVALALLKGKTTADWLRETLRIEPDLRGPLDWAISRYSIPRPPVIPDYYHPAIQVQQWAPFAALNAVFDEAQSVNAGFGVDGWRPEPFRTGLDAWGEGRRIGDLFAGIQVDAVVRDHDAWLYRVGYHITLLGRIRFIRSEDR